VRLSKAVWIDKVFFSWQLRRFQFAVPSSYRVYDTTHRLEAFRSSPDRTLVFEQTSRTPRLVCQLGKLLGRPWRKLDTAKLRPRSGIPENAGEEPLYFVLAIRIFVGGFLR